MIALCPGRPEDPELEFETFHETPGAGRMTDGRREYLLDIVEDAMLTGATRPRRVLEMLNSAEARKGQPGVTDIRTIKHLMELVWERWRDRNRDPEGERARLLAECEALGLRHHEIMARAIGESNLNAQVGAGRNLITLYEKRAELLGLRTLTLKPDPEAEARMQQTRYAELMAQRSADPISDVYGSVLPDQGQGNGSDDSVSAEQPSAANP